MSLEAGYNAAQSGRVVYVQGQLFTEYFLEEGIRDTSEWRDLDASDEWFESAYID